MQLKNSNVWSVRFTLPAIPDSADKGRRYAANRNVVCFCETVDEALVLVRTQHPDAKVYGVNHRGKEEMYWDGGSREYQLPRGLTAEDATPSGSVGEKP